MPRLSARKILNEGWALVTENFWQVIGIAFLPIVVALVMIAFTPQDYFSHPVGLGIEHGINVLMAVFFAVQWYRFILSGKRSRGISMLRFGVDEIRYLFTYLIFWILPYLVVVFFVKIQYGHSALMMMTATEVHHFLYTMGWWAFLLAVYYCCALRWILIFPAVAMGQSMNPGISWQQTRGKWWLLVRTFLYFAIWYTIIVYGVIALIGIAISGWGILIEPIKALHFMGDHRQGGLFFEWGSLTLGIVIEYCLWAWFLSITAVLYKHITAK